MKTRSQEQLGPRPRDSPLATGATCVLYRYRTVLYRTGTVPYSCRTVPYANILESSRTVLYRTFPYRTGVLWCRSRHPRNIPLLYIGNRVHYFQSTVTVLVLEVNLLDRPFGSLLPSEWGLGFLPWLSMTSPRVSVLYCQSPGSKVQSPKSGVQSPKSRVRGPY